MSSTADVHVDGLVVIEDFIDQATHDELLAYFTDSERSWEDTLSRRVQHYAYVLFALRTSGNDVVKLLTIFPVCTTAFLSTTARCWRTTQCQRPISRTSASR